MEWASEGAGVEKSFPNVIFSERAYSAVVAETLEHLKTETGGVFLGIRTENTWFVLETLDPGPKSIFQPTYFEYDTGYVNHLANKTAKFYETPIFLMGLWHRHPGSLDTFSFVDHGTNKDYVRICHGSALSGLINIDPHFRMTLYHVSHEPQRSVPVYAPVAYQVSDESIPRQYLKRRTTTELLMSQSLCHVAASAGGLYAAQTVNTSPAATLDIASRIKRIVKSVYPEQTAAAANISDRIFDRSSIVEAFTDEIEWLSMQGSIESQFYIRQGVLDISIPSLKLQVQFSLSKTCDKVARINGHSFPYQPEMLLQITAAAQRKMIHSTGV